MAVVEGKIVQKMQIEITWQEAYNAVCAELNMDYLKVSQRGDGNYIDNGRLINEDRDGRKRVITDDPDKLVLFQSLDIIRRRLKAVERSRANAVDRAKGV